MNEAENSSADLELPRPSGTMETQTFHAESMSTWIGDRAQGTELPEDLPQIDGIAILRRLGSGGCGAVYLAEDERIHRQVAIKLLHRQFHGDPTSILQEARAQGAVEHPHVVPIYQVGQIDPDVFYIVSKFLPGGTLHHRMRADAIPVETAVEIAIQIADALAFAHQKGLIHRDLKPANILLDESGTAYVSDFGLALHEDNQRDRRNEISGTPAYMAPEQIEGRSHHLDGRTDVWGLGVTLYEMLGGVRPFEASTTLELFEEISQREAKPLRQRNPNIPQRLEEIVLKCLRKSPADRYATAGDLANELRGWHQSVQSPTANVASSPSGKPIAWIVGLLACIPAGIIIYFVSNPNEQKDLDQIAQAAKETPIARPAQAPLSAKISLRVWGDGKNGIPLDDPLALPLRNGDQVRLDVDLSEPAHVYLLWVDAKGEVMEIFPHDPELGLLEDKPRAKIQSPKTINRGWPVLGVTGMETAVVLVKKKPYPAMEELIQQWNLPPMREFNSPRELVSYHFDANTVKPGIQKSAHRGLDKVSSKIDDPILDLMERLRKEFDLGRIVRVAHIGDE